MKVYAFILGKKSRKFQMHREEQSLITLYGYVCTLHSAIRVWSIVYLCAALREPLPR